MKTNLIHLEKNLKVKLSSLDLHVTKSSASKECSGLINL